MLSQHPTAVVLPLRSLSRGKHRLAGVLDEGERRRLITWMADRVIAAARDLPVFVVHDDEEVAFWASERGAVPLLGVNPGLNAAVAEGVDHVRRAGCERVIVSHADLPLAADLRPLAAVEERGIAIVPDRLGDGTNVLSIPTNVDFGFAYGPGSFEHHVRAARTLGIEPEIRRIDTLAFDVDHPEDLELLRSSLPEVTRELEIL